MDSARTSRAIPRLPLELEETATIDGAPRYRIFFSIVLPLAKPGLAAAFLLVLISTWNEYLLALFLSTANTRTLACWWRRRTQPAGRGGGTLIVIMIIPVIAIAVALERYITRGLLIGAIKE